MYKKAYGFTIVELLIVIVVIAILAAVTIVSYTNISSRAKTATLQQEMSQLQRKIEVDTLERTGNTVVVQKPLAYLTKPGDVLLTAPLVDAQEIALYAVFDTSNDTSSNWAPVAYLAPRSVSDNEFRIVTRSSSSTGVAGLYSTLSASNLNIATSDIRNTTGRHVGWMTTATPGQIGAGFDSAVGDFRALPSHSGWNFDNLQLAADRVDITSVAALVFAESHDESTRRSILQWLDSQYDIDYYN